MIFEEGNDLMILKSLIIKKSFQMKILTLMIHKTSIISQPSMIQKEFQLEVWNLIKKKKSTVISIFDGLVFKGTTIVIRREAAQKSFRIIIRDQNSLGGHCLGLF